MLCVRIRIERLVGGAEAGVGEVDRIVQRVEEKGGNYVAGGYYAVVDRRREAELIGERGTADLHRHRSRR